MSCRFYQQIRVNEVSLTSEEVLLLSLPPFTINVNHLQPGEKEGGRLWVCLMCKLSGIAEILSYARAYV